MSKLLIILLSLMCSTCLFSQTAEEETISTIFKAIDGKWRSVPEKNAKAKTSEFKIEITDVEPTKTKNLYTLKGSIVGFAIEDGYVYYKGNVLAFGYTYTSIIGINPRKQETEYTTGTIQDGKLTLVGYSPKSSTRILSGSVWERP